jgi:hypothetical protein
MELHDKTDAAISAHPLLTETEVAALLRVNTGTLANWRWRRSGPPYLKVGSTVRYPRTALAAYMQSVTVEPCRAA